PGSREPIRLHPMPLELQPVVTALNQQLERLEDALIRERRFSADVAHELRTPLTTALISVESAIAAGSPADAALPLAQAHQALEVLARRVGQLLALARLEAGAADSARTPVDLSALAVETIEELAQAIHDSGVEVSLHLPASPVQIDGFPAGLAALLRNLIENSLRHVDAGGHVAVSVGTRSDSATIDVSDDGPGIPMARRAEVFTRFHRESSARGDGYGLGLSIVQRAAELHAAKIELLDPPHGPGLRVRVTFSHPPTRMPEPDRR
ncbi:MAG TPA: ATP-binding protein, partial [Rhodanobacteraceae bacterium]|nr:ATP-binding protein [Rhodanobacteraceae bacterium]